jgi:Tfp pilus assembly protein PilN
MRLRSPRLGVVLLGDRLTAAILNGDRVDGFTVDAENPSATLRAELDARRVSSRTVALGLARTLVAVKPIELPAVGGELREMVHFELERHLPFPAEDAPFDFMALPAEPNGHPGATAGGRRVLVAAAERRLVDTGLRLAEEARLRPISVTIASHDLLSLARPARGQHVVWVHRLGAGADILFLVGSAVVVSRNVASTDDEVLSEEIRRSLAVLRWKKCDGVWVSGDGPPVAVDGPLTDMGAPVTEPPYSSRVRAQLAALPDESRAGLQLALAVATSRRVPGLDLLPPALRPRRFTRAQIVTVGMVAVTAATIIAALLVPGFRERQYLGRVNSEISRLDPDVRSVERVLRELERKRKLLGTVSSIESSAVRPLPVLRELTDIMPSDAWLTTVSLDAKGVELTGQAAAASALIPILENSPRLERVEFSSPVTRGRDREQFRIRAAWEAGAAQVPVGPVTSGLPPGAPSGPTAPSAPPARPAPTRPVPGQVPGGQVGAPGVPSGRPTLVIPPPGTPPGAVVPAPQPTPVPGAVAPPGAAGVDPGDTRRSTGGARGGGGGRR